VTRKLRLAVEFLLLFVALPLVLAGDVVRLPLLPTLWLIALGCLVVLLFDRGFDRRCLWNAEHLGRRLKQAALPFLLAAPVLTVAVVLFEPERLFQFVRERPLIWAIVMVLYPILSVYPQGVVYRAFIFHRYRELFPQRAALIGASAIAFALVHLVFRNPIAPPLSLLGGVLFAWTYDRTRSSLVAAIQHALFGCYIFTVGWGWYFYHGATRVAG
jgi:membrane protease YdiL (CAAX protease family)